MRKQIDYLIPEDSDSDKKNRDAGKTFKIIEMPAVQAEKWCYKAISGMMKNGMDLPLNALTQPAEVAKILGVASFLRMDFLELEPLLDEMMKCVKYCFIRGEEHNYPQSYRELNINNDIEEIGTIVNLRIKIFELHMDFFDAVLGGIISKFQAQAEPTS